MRVAAILTTGVVRDLKVPEGVTLDQVHAVLKDGDTWPEMADAWDGWFLNPAHIVAIRQYEE